MKKKNIPKDSLKENPPRKERRKSMVAVLALEYRMGSKHNGQTIRLYTVVKTWAI